MILHEKEELPQIFLFLPKEQDKRGVMMLN